MKTNELSKYESIQRAKARKVKTNETDGATARTIRIKTGHYYVRAEHPGISGFQDWTRKVESVVTGRKARNNRCSIVREYLATGLGQFRLGDGHLPEYQPVVSEVEMLRWLDANPFCEAVKVELVLAPQPVPSFSNRACSDCGKWAASGGPLCEDCAEDALNG